MYLPAHFEVTDVPTICAHIEAHPLGTLVTVDELGLHADHIPFLYEDAGDGEGRLIGYVARASDAWRRTGNADVLVVFQGPSAYISPNWYPSKREHHRVVPTYN